MANEMGYRTVVRRGSSKDSRMVVERAERKLLEHPMAVQMELLKADILVMVVKKHLDLSRAPLIGMG